MKGGEFVFYNTQANHLLYRVYFSGFGQAIAVKSSLCDLVLLNKNNHPAFFGAGWLFLFMGKGCLAQIFQAIRHLTPVCLCLLL